MKICISGASGFIGKNLSYYLEQKGHKILKLSRTDISQSCKNLSEKIEDADIIINLAGAPILKRWTPFYKEQIYNSRIITTQKIVDAINLCSSRPELFISGSAIGIYSNNEIHTESSNSFESSFLGTVCKDWEETAKRAVCNRIVITRFGVVLSKFEGAFPKMSTPFKYGIGGKIGSGKQSFSFIHIEDVLRAFQFIIENNSVSGVVNLVAPESTTNSVVTYTLSALLKKPAFFTVPAFVLKMLYGDGASVLLEGQNVVPEKLLQKGFVFKYKTIEDTLKGIIN